MMVTVPTFQTILDIVAFVTICPAPGCELKVEPGSLCKEHLENGLGKDHDICPLCHRGWKVIRSGCCQSCSKRVHEMRHGRSGAVILQGHMISEVCVVPDCGIDVMRSKNPWPLCPDHREVAEWHYVEEVGAAYEHARDLIRVQPKRFCGIGDCLNTVSRLGMCQSCYLNRFVAGHEFLKGVKPGSARLSSVHAKKRRLADGEDSLEANKNSSLPN